MVTINRMMATAWALSLTGCAAAAIGAGAAGGIAYTERGAKGTAKGDVAAVTEKSRQALQNMGVQVTGSEIKNSGAQASLTGKSGSKDVTVSLNSAQGNMTQVEVVAKEGALKWNKDYAGQVLSNIVQQNG
jgi:uncharacterized protein (DUF849 family)